MVYAYDLWALMPIKDLYDTQMALAAVGAAKDMYDKKLQELKELKKDYSDFYSPFSKDMQRYSEMINGVKNIINNAYDNGIDVLRNKQGMRIIRNAIDTIDREEFNMMKAAAKYGELYLQNKAKLNSLNKYSDDAEQYRLRLLGLPSFDEFSTRDPETGKLRMWGELSPIEYQTLKDATNDWYDKRTPYLLDKAGVQSFDMPYDPNAKYVGWTMDDNMKIAGENIPGWQGSFWSDYYRDRARNTVALSGGDPNDENAVQLLLLKDIANSLKEWLVRPTADYDDYYKRVDLAIKRQNANNRGDSSNHEKTSYGQVLMLRGLNNIGALSNDPIKELKDAYDFGDYLHMLQTTKPDINKISMAGLERFFNKNVTSAIAIKDMYKQRYTMYGAESQEAFLSRFDASQKFEGKVVVDPGILNRIYDESEVRSSTLGNHESVKHTDRQAIESFGGNGPLYMWTTTNVWSSPTKRFNNELYVEVILENEEGSRIKKYYKIFESEPVKAIPYGSRMYAPNGLTVIPSERTSNWFSIEDNKMNKAAGLASEDIRGGQGEYININN